MRPEQDSWFKKLAGRLRGQKASEVGSAQVPPGNDDERHPFSASGRQREKDVMGTWGKGQVILDDFVVERLLGEGGMGAVYLVRSRSTGQSFAVKRVRLRDAANQRSFLAELQTWIDLPEHPHLTACRFFRTVGEEVLIFAEYVEGGSLAEWIQNRRLTSQGQILDVAIQFAWGLHALHELGLVHQDVKPGNVLMTPEGLAKVADFGLARARAKAGEEAVSDSLRIMERDRESPQSFLVSYLGMTPAYCSPEQARGEPLSQKTDIWSWGLSVLEMFIGQVTWTTGIAAAEVLEDYVRTGRPTMPAKVAEVLRRCFREPTERWASMAEPAEVLKQIYRQEVGQQYARPVPPTPLRDQKAAITHDRRTTTGGQWTDPRLWLVMALAAAGRDVAEAEMLLPPRSGSRKAQAVADLAAYEEARRIFERLVAKGRKELETQLATLCIEKAFVQESAEDLPGAVALYDRAIEVWERLVNVEGRRELANDLAMAYTNKATALWDLGDNRAALALYDRAIEVWERLVNVEGRRELANGLATAYTNKANALWDFGDNRAALALYDRAIEVWERLVNVEGHTELANDLAMAYTNKANAAQALGDYRAAVGLYDRAIEIYERLVNQEGRRELANNLATGYVNKAIAVRALGDNRAALALYDRAIEFREQLVNVEGHRELANDLAMAYTNKANAAQALGDYRAAVGLHDRAIEIYERLVNQEGRRELANNLAMGYVNKAIAVRALGDNRAAVGLYDRAIEIYERLVNQEGWRELQGDLARATVYRAVVLLALGSADRARSEAQESLAILKAEIARTGRADFQAALNWATQALKDVL